MQLHNPRIEGGEAEGKETELGQLKGQVGKMARKDRMTKEREQRRKERRSGGRLVLGVGKRVSVLVLGVGCRVRKERLVDLWAKA